MSTLEDRIRRAWQGRISGCQLGKPVERMSMIKGYDVLKDYLDKVQAEPIDDYIVFEDGHGLTRECCRGHILRSEPDDDINYSVLALLMLEDHGADLTTANVAQAWLQLLPAAQTYTAERAAYRVLLQEADEWFAERGDPGFDLNLCSDNPFNDWIGAQIRADVYGWVCPGNPALAADLAGRDAALSHRSDGVWGAVFVAALGAALAVEPAATAIETALQYIPDDSRSYAAVRLGLELVGNENGGQAIRDAYADLSPVHTINNLAIVVWALMSHLDDFTAAIGSAVAAGLDTDCNGATVGALWGLQGGDIPDHWTAPWQGRVGLTLAGHDEVTLDHLVDRTVQVAGNLAG